MVVKNRMHMMVASNEGWFVPVGFDNRRFAVFKTSTERQNDTKFFSAVRKELFEQGGLAALLYDLLDLHSTIDLRDIPNTDELNEQKYRSMHPREAWWYDVLCDGTVWRDAKVVNSKEYAVDPDALYNEYLIAVQRGAKNVSLGMKGALGRFLRDMLPNPYPLPRQESGGGRKRYWVFPPIHAARDHFARKFWKKAWSERGSSEDLLTAGEESEE
jgi:hypothetical protein